MTTYIWPEGGGGSGGDPNRFAPKYIVGNELAGDDPTYTFAGGFIYIPDPGDGTGIQAALSQASLAPGDVWIRPGTYDFGTGAVAMPLTIPAGTRVQGSGNTTTLIAKTVGDQGVFVLAAGGMSADQSALSSLRDLAIVVPQVADPTGSLSAVLVKAGGCAITGVNFDVTTTDQSVLRHAILVDTGGANVLPVTSIETTSIILNVASYVVSPTPPLTSGIRVIEGQVAARNVTILGGDIGVEITNNNTDPNTNPGGALFFGSQMEIANPSQYAVLTQQATGAVNVAAVRISESVFFADFAATPPLGAGTSVGAKLEASFVSTFRSVITVGFTRGYDVVRPVLGSPVSAQIDDCGIFLCDLGVRLNGASGCSVSDTEIGTDVPVQPSPLTVSANKGVLIENSANSISVTNNIIRVADWTGTGATTYGVYCDGQSDNLFIEGNEIDHAASPGTFATITVLDSTDVVVADNHVSSESSVGAIVITDAVTSRVTITGNTIVMPNAAVPPVGIDVYVAKRVTITGNAIDHSAHADPLSGGAAIRIRPDPVSPLPSRCTVTGNTIQPSTTGATPAIAIDGDENTCANNVCSLDVPPATPAIAVSGGNNVVIGNVCRTAPAVADTGIGNEVAHNI
jgi:hypothetical protein